MCIFYLGKHDLFPRGNNGIVLQVYLVILAEVK